MKKIENNFTVTGFLGKDAEIREFTNSSVARFPLAVSRQERNAEETNRISAFMNIEAWRKNENTGSFDQLTKGTMLTIEGYFRPEEWTDKVGVKHNRVVMVAVKFYPPIEKEDVPEKPVKPVKKEADPKGQLLAFIRIVSECDDRYCRGHHSHYSLQIIPTFPVCCSMTTCRCRAPFRYPYQLVDTHTQPLSSSRYSHVKNIAILLIIKGIAIVFV